MSEIAESMNKPIASAVQTPQADIPQRQARPARTVVKAFPIIIYTRMFLTAMVMAFSMEMEVMVMTITTVMCCGGGACG